MDLKKTQSILKKANSLVRKAAGSYAAELEKMRMEMVRLELSGNSTKKDNGKNTSGKSK